LTPTLVHFTGLPELLFDPNDEDMPVRVVSGATETWSTILDVTDDSPTAQTLELRTAASPGDQVVEVYEPTFGLRIRERGREDVIVAGLDLRDTDRGRELLAGAPVTFRKVSGVPFPPRLLPDLPAPGVRMLLSGGDDGIDPDPPPTPVARRRALRESFERALTALELSDLPDIVVAPDLWSRIFATKGVDRFAFEPEDAIALADEMVLSAERTKDRVVIVDPPLGGPDGLQPFSERDLGSWRTDRANALGSARDFAATYTPWARIVAGPVFRGDDTLIVPPSAHVAGQMCLTARARGPWISTGNVALEQVVELEQTLSAAAEERLQDIGINPLRMALPRGATIQGVRSLSWPDRKPWRFLSTRRLFNYLRRALRPIGLSYVFESNAPATWVSLRRDLERLLRDLYSAGGLAGSKPESAFVVRVDDTLNPEAARDAGVLTAEIGVAPAMPLEFLVVRLVVQAGDADVVEEPIAP
jgi:hypothetical protein